MFGVLALAAVGSAVVFALAALVRRRSRSYLLVALALSTLLARTAVAVLSATGRLGPVLHHVFEHGLDVTMAGLVIAAVYDARSAHRSARESSRSEPSLEPDGGESSSARGRRESASAGRDTDAERGEDR
jgi:hypothetical protein